MSYDRKIDQVCTHQVVEEALFVEQDRLTIRPLRPIASSASVSIFLNHAFDVPPMGVVIPAQAVGTKDGPFNITRGVNDTLVFKINQGALQTAVLPAANQLPIAQLAFLLNTQVNGVVFSASGNKIAFQTTAEGDGASIFFTSASTLALTLGIPTNREFRGQLLVPGWTIVTDPNSIPQFPVRAIIFDQPLRSNSDFVEIDYSTINSECRRCGGSNVENDWTYDNSGEVIVVRDEALLIQEIQKDFFTLLGSNPFHTWYGTSLLDTIGKKLTSGNFIQNLIVSDIYQAFERWQQIKRQQEEQVQQTVTDEEFPFRLLSVNLQQSTKDPTVIFVEIDIQNRSQKPIQLTRGLRVPLPVDLLGSSQQQGIIRQSLSNFVLTG